MIDPAAAAALVQGVKSDIAAIRELMGLAREVGQTLPAGANRDEVRRGLDEAESQLQIAEAHIAQVLGCQPC